MDKTQPASKSKGRERYGLEWSSRMGPEAARSAYLFRVLCKVACSMVAILTVAGAITMVQGLFPLAYTAYGLIVFGAAPLLFLSIIALHKALEAIRRRYGLIGIRTTRMPWSVLASTEDFDRWIIENQRTDHRPRQQ